MMDAHVIDRFIAFTNERYRLLFTGRNQLQLTMAVESRCRELNISNPMEYLDLVRQNRREEARYIDRVTTGETSFFRYPDVISYYRQYLFDRLSKPESSVRILHIGCSTGEEPYTICILLDQMGFLDRRPVVVNAIDLNRLAIEKARSGIYSANALRGTPREIREYYFKQTGKLFELRPDIRRHVQFQCMDVFQIPHTGLFMSYDVIFCMNVMIYFDKPAIEDLILLFKRLMTPESHLVLGPVDSIIRMNEVFHTHRETGFCRYGLKTAAQPPPKRTLPSYGKRPAKTRPVISVHSVPIPTDLTCQHKKDTNDYALGVAAYEQKDFDRAVSFFEEGIRKMDRVSDCYAGLARIYADRGDNVQAAETAESAIRCNEANAEAHLILGVIHFQMNQYEAASAHFQRSLELNPECRVSRNFLKIVSDKDQKDD